MKSELTLESVEKEFARWRRDRGPDRRMPPELLRAAALMAEKSSVAEVAARLGLNQTRLSQCVSLIQNERLAFSTAGMRDDRPREFQKPAAESLTFTKVAPSEFAKSVPETRPRKSKIYARLVLPGGVRCEVTSLRSFRALCKIILKGNA